MDGLKSQQGRRDEVRNKWEDLKVFKLGPEIWSAFCDANSEVPGKVLFFLFIKNNLFWLKLVDCFIPPFEIKTQGEKRNVMIVHAKIIVTALLVHQRCEPRVHRRCEPEQEGKYCAVLLGLLPSGFLTFATWFWVRNCWFSPRLCRMAIRV